MVKDVPHGYDNSVQFNYEKKNLIGREWNTPTTFQVNIRPKVVTEAGLEI